MNGPVVISLTARRTQNDAEQYQVPESIEVNTKSVDWLIDISIQSLAVDIACLCTPDLVSSIFLSVSTPSRLGRAGIVYSLPL